LLIYELRNYRESAATNLRAQAELVAATSAPALAFDDRKAAISSLELLKYRSDIVVAALYMPSGELYALFQRDASDAPPPQLPDWAGARYEKDHVLVSHRIVENGVVVGTLVMRAQFDLWTRFFDYLAILGAVILGSLGLALLISSWLQRAVTKPILALADAARSVVDRRDFSVRVPKSTGGEIGLLVDAFNTMLAEVGQRTTALEESNRGLKQESADRAAAEAALKYADRRKDEFLATLAHELRNPLAPMTNSLAILRSASLDPRLARIREVMERQLRQLVRLVDDLLDVSRITTGKLVVRKEVVDLGAIVRGAVDTANPLLEAREHRLSVQVPAEPVLLHADAVRLAQVIGNLLNNAAKYTEPGGRIDLRVTLDGDHAAVRISDNGIGISPEMLAEVFEMFRQADNSLERINAGLGVGLTLARRLVELHGGTITAHSAGLGAGSQFVVRLPIMKVGAAARSQAPHDARNAVHGQRVMIVDDNADFADTLATLLRQLGHEVAIAYDPLEAIREAPQFQPDFAFLDIGLPGMSGYDLAQRFRAMPQTASTVLIAATGYGQDTDRERARKAGFDRHVVKPVELMTIEAIFASYSDHAVRRYTMPGAQ
jgi:signal transduction histidine kinase/ActR/RegA family two-component response regulator